jgi:protein TonB
MIIVRYIIVGGLALVITLSLFLLMQSLIAMGEDQIIEDIGTTKIIDFVRLKRETAAPEEEEKLPEKQAQQEAPPPPDFNMPSSGAGGEALSLNIDAPAIENTKPEIGLGDGPTLGGAASDADVIPLVRVQPMYPPTAAQARIEGWVRLVFDINTTGSVKNARVIASQPPDVFDMAALQAIKKWKYKPKIENGERVERYNIVVQLTFELENL